MKNTTCSGTVERNSAGSRTTQPQPISGCQGVGSTAQDLARLGAGYAQTAGICAEAPSADPRRSHGEQAGSPGLFGVPSITGRGRRYRQMRATTPARILITPAMRLAAAAADERERIGIWQDEEADFVRHCAGAGQVEFTLALEGN